MSRTILEQIGAFVADMAFEQLPKEVVDKANSCFFDLIGCYFGALASPSNQEVLKGITRANPSAEALVWGSGIRTGSAEAALAIGHLCYELEYDDGISMAGHWGSASIPATWIANALHGGDGKRLIAAIVAAYEAGTRISRFFSPRLLKGHVHFPCTMGPFAAITGYAKASGAPAEVITGALALAGLFPQGTYSTAISGAPCKGLYSGWPNYLGVNAVRFAHLGLKGDADVLENEDGFGITLGLAPVRESDYDEILGDMGQRYRIMNTYYKPYPCCRWLHAPVTAVLELMRRHNLTRADIQEINVYGPAYTKMYNTHEGYEAKVTCQYSIPYSVGAAVWFGRLGLEEYEEEARLNPELRAFARRIQVKTDPELDAAFPKVFSVRVELILSDGRTLDALQGHPWGPESPPEQDELEEKFRYLCKKLLPEEDIAAWIDCYRSGFDDPAAYNTVCHLLEQQYIAKE